LAIPSESSTIRGINPSSMKGSSCSAPRTTPSCSAVIPPERTREIALRKAGSFAPFPTERARTRTDALSSYTIIVATSRLSSILRASRAPRFAFSIFPSDAIDPDLSSTRATASGARTVSLLVYGRTSALTTTFRASPVCTTGVSAVTSKTTVSDCSAKTVPAPRTAAAHTAKTSSRTPFFFNNIFTTS